MTNDDTIYPTMFYFFTQEYRVSQKDFVPVIHLVYPSSLKVLPILLTLTPTAIHDIQHNCESCTLVFIAQL